MPTYCQKYYATHREQILQLQRERRRDPVYREKMRQYYLNYYARNRTRILELARARRRRSRCVGGGPAAHFSVDYGKFSVSFD
jgi:hypothetical protein